MVSVIHCSMPSTSTEWCLIMVVELVSIRPERLEWKSRQHSYRWTWEELHGMTQETPNFPQTIEPKLLLLIEKLSKRIICTGRGEEMKPERQLSTLNLYNDSNRVTTLSFCVCVCVWSVCCMCLCIYECSWRPEKGVGSSFSGTGITNRWLWAAIWMLGIKLGSSPKQSMTLKRILRHEVWLSRAL